MNNKMFSWLRLIAIVLLVGWTCPVSADINCETVNKDEEIRKLETATQNAINALHQAVVANANGDAAAATDAQIDASEAARDARNAWLKLIHCDLLDDAEQEAANIFADTASKASTDAGRLGGETRKGNQLFEIVMIIVVIFGGVIIVIYIVRRR